MNYINSFRCVWAFIIAHVVLAFILQISATNEESNNPYASDYPVNKRGLLALHKSKDNKNQACLFSGKRYPIGGKWQHILDPSTANICVSCTCYQAGKVTCESNYCSDINCDDDEPDECCQICGDDDESASDSPSSTSKQDDGSESGKDIFCYHNGRKIWDGQIFSSNSTGIQKTRTDQCVQCICQSGMVLCRLKTCQSIDCPTPVYSSDDCCPACPEQPPQYAPHDKQEIDERSKGCMSGGHLYSDGEQWHPVIGPFGQMDCVLCECQRGKIDCNRLSCPEVPPCTRPRQIPGQCCPVCPRDNLDGPQDKKGHLKCFPESTDTIVYKEVSNNGDVHQFAFQTSGSVLIKLVVLALKEDRTIKFTDEDLPEKEFNVKIKTGKFKVIGATRSRLVQRFARKSRRLSERCVNRCEKRIDRLANALKLKQLEKREECQMEFGV